MISLQIRLRSIFAAVSVTGLVALMLSGYPLLGVAIAMPWISVWLVHRQGLLLAAYLYIPFYKSVLMGYVPVDLTVWLAFLCIISLLMDFRNRRTVGLTAPGLSWFGFLLVLLLAAATSQYAFDSTFIVAETIALTIVPLLLALIVAGDPEQLQKFLKVTLLLSIVISMFGLISFVLGDVGRLELTSNTIGTGRIAVLGFLVAPVVLKRSPMKQFWVTCIWVVTLFAAVASGSRGPLVAAFLTVLAVYVLPNRWMAVRLLIAIGGAAIGIAILMSSWIESIVPVQSLYRFRLFFDAGLGGGEVDQSSGVRLDMYQLSLEMWASRPVLGWGPGSFEPISAASKLVPGSYEYPHNAVLQTVAELGMLGLIVTTVLYATVFLNIYRCISNPIAKGIGSLTIFALVSAQFSNNLYDNRWMWGMLLLAGSMSLVTLSAKVKS